MGRLLGLPVDVMDGLRRQEATGREFDPAVREEADVPLVEEVNR
ncbi:hypothetical protein RH858_05380 [Halalkaliarchaeum sp. AArc-GB]|nr:MULTISPECIES: hypothetical protein [unclassified Halalkaliarchaeum]MDR5672579.1 hypothetical protein [Halalkaliarchaeum sp. AArc-GB]